MSRSVWLKWTISRKLCESQWNLHIQKQVIELLRLLFLWILVGEIHWTLEIFCQQIQVLIKNKSDKLKGLSKELRFSNSDFCESVFFCEYWRNCVNEQHMRNLNCVNKQWSQILWKLWSSIGLEVLVISNLVGWVEVGWQNGKHSFKDENLKFKFNLLESICFIDT